MRRFYIFMLLIFSCFGYLFAQDNVSDEIPILDSMSIAIDKYLEQGDKVSAIKLMNEKSKRLFDKGLYANELVILNTAIKLSDEGRDTVKYPEIKELYMESLNAMGGAYSYVAKYEDAVASYIKMDKYNNGSNPLYMAKFYNGMGVVFSMSGKYDQAKGYYVQALSVVNKIEDEQWRLKNAFAISANLGGVLLFKKSYDSAHIYIMDAYKLALLLKDKSMELNCLQLLGTLNGSIGNNELAISYYNSACDVAWSAGLHYVIPSTKLNMSQIYLMEKDYESAFATANEALDLSRKFNMKKLEMNALSSISKLYKQKQNPTTALFYLEESNKIRDSLFSQDNEERFLRQKTDFDMYKIAVEKEIFDKNAEIKEWRRIINNLIISIIISLLIIALVYLTHRLIKQERERKKLNEQHDVDINVFIDKQKDFESELEKKNRELLISSLSVAKINELSGLLMQKLKIIKSNIPSKNKALDTVREAEDLVLELTKGGHIGELNECLKRVPDDFYDKLELRYPDLTLSERKICALMSFGLSSKDIANMTGKTNGAIGNVKFRIRQKINVDIGVDLEDFMFHIRES